MHVMRLHVPTEFVLVILWTTFRGVYELKKNLYSSIDQNQVFHSGMTNGFGLKIPSSCNHYKNFKIRYSSVQIVIFILDPL